MLKIKYLIVILLLLVNCNQDTKQEKYNYEWEVSCMNKLKSYYCSECNFYTMNVDCNCEGKRVVFYYPCIYVKKRRIM
jgi:hypothetical protein